MRPGHLSDSSAPSAADRPRGARVLGSFIHALSWDEALQRLSDWASRNESRVVCICNVHSVVTARRQTGFAQVLASADLATPDGAPVAWMLRRLGHRGQQRINGPDLMARYCALAAARGEPMFLYGSTPQVLDDLQAILRERLPGIRIAGAISPPFREVSPEEDRQIIDQINHSGAGIVWVGLGCPKQEQWMAAHRPHVRAVMVGVGAAFDYLAGTTRRAPQWMQDAGLEWLHRLASEPVRLLRRYLFTNSYFVMKAAAQLASHAFRRPL